MPSTKLEIFIRLQGIPCYAVVGYIPGTPPIGPAYDHGGIPGDPPEVEIDEFKDQKGYPAPWLFEKYNKMDDKEREDFEIDLVNKAEEIIMDEEADLEAERYRRNQEDR